MQKVKRKSNENDTGSPNKKKFTPNKTKSDSDQVEDGKNNNFKKNFNDKSKGPNKFGKPNFSKDQGKGGKGKPFSKDLSKGGKGKPFFKDQNKGGHGKPNFSKDQTNGEKPKWSEMKKEKKELRLVRRKAKATAEVFEVSHKAKMLAAQIQR